MFPAFLHSNDQIRIISPSGVIDIVFIDGATRLLASWGYEVTEGLSARAHYGRYAGTEEQRIFDLQHALDDPTVKAILCSRGGYGLSQIIDKIDLTAFKKYPKWVIGFSDITILHNAISNLGVASIHGLMAKHLTELPSDALQVVRLHEVLKGDLPTYTLSANSLNRTGVGRGKLVGGNLSVLMGLRGSQFDLDYSNAILFIEEIAEKPYHIDRMIQNLRFSGVLSQLSGLIVGQFSDCDEDEMMKKSIHEIIFDAVRDYNYPVCFNFPAGHVDDNYPLLLGATVSLEVSSQSSVLRF